MSDCTLGIDPGQKGGLVFLDDTGQILALAPMQTLENVADLIELMQPKRVYIEKSHAMPGQGVVSMFNYGDHFGQLKGVCVGLNIPYVLVPPRTWQKTMFEGTNPTEQPKARALSAARRLFPGHSFIATERSSKPHSGLVDASLIALWGYYQKVMDQPRSMAS